MNNEQSKDIDSLTKLTNRSQFNKYLEEQWQRLALEQKPLSLIMGNIDYLKIYNAHYGHNIGDDLICQIASSIRDSANSLGGIAITARWGGDEFCVILPDTDSTDAIQIAEKIRSEVNALQIINEHPDLSYWVSSKIVTVSWGVSTTIPDINISPGQLLQAVDAAMYQAKEEGRDRVIFKEFSI